MIAAPHVVSFILRAPTLLVVVSTGKVVIMAWFLLAKISVVVVFGVVVLVDTAGPAILVKLGETEGCAVFGKEGLTVWIKMGSSGGRCGGGSNGTWLGGGDCCRNRC